LTRLVNLLIQIIHNTSTPDLGPSQAQKLYIDLWVETRNNIMTLRPGHINQKDIILSYIRIELCFISKMNYIDGFN